MVKTKMKAKTKNILLIVLSCILIFGAVFGIIAMFGQDESTTKKVSPSYAVGGLTADGKYMETKESIYTKDAFECIGLKAELDFDATISYKLYFYDVDKNFISSSENLTSSFNSNETLMPYGVRYCRIVIMPNNDTDIKWYEINGYSKQLSLEVSKNQDSFNGTETTTWTDNLFVVDNSLNGKYFSGSLTTYGESEFYTCSQIISVVDYSQIKIIASSLSETNVAILHFGRSDEMKSEISNQHLIVANGNYLGNNTWLFDIPNDCAYVGLSACVNIDYTILAK